MAERDVVAERDVAPVVHAEELVAQSDAQLVFVFDVADGPAGRAVEARDPVARRRMRLQVSLDVPGGGVGARIAGAMAVDLVDPRARRTGRHVPQVVGARAVEHRPEHERLGYRDAAVAHRGRQDGPAQHVDAVHAGQRTPLVRWQPVVVNAFVDVFEQAPQVPHALGEDRRDHRQRLVQAVRPAVGEPAPDALAERRSDVDVAIGPFGRRRYGLGKRRGQCRRHWGAMPRSTGRASIRIAPLSVRIPAPKRARESSTRMSSPRASAIRMDHRDDRSAQPPPPRGSGGVPLSEGERRHATVVLADLCGYTAMTEVLDPEEVARLLNRILEAAGNVIEAHGGMVNQFVGDRITALFGIPWSHDDDPRRAVAATLEMHRLVRVLNAEIGGMLPEPLVFHSGINTGLLVTQRRDGREGTFGVTGDVVNTASRLQSSAAPDEILIGAETHRAIEALFVTEALGPHAFKGKSQPVDVYRVVGLAARTRFEAARRRGLSRYTGREREHERLDQWLAELGDGRGRFVTVVGDPGLGKSRLVFELRRAAEHDATVLEGHCESYGTVTPYHAFLDVIRQAFGVRSDDAPEAAVPKVAAAATAFGTDVEARVPVYLYLLSVRSAAHALPPNVTQDQLRVAILDGMQSLVAAVTRRRPVVLLLEDWHWADEGSDLALQSIARLTTERPLLVMVTRRPDSEPGWSDVRTSTLRLRPLVRAETAVIVGSRFGGGALPDGLVALIHERTGGNPFFIEEVCRSLAESSVRVGADGTVELLRPLAELAMPEAVHAVVRARIDRLDPRAREILRIAAVLGRTFSLRLLRAMVDDAGSLLPALHRLEDAELIAQLPDVGDEQYFGFTHAITQDVAYDLFLLQRRSELHARAGAAIEALYGASLRPHYEMLAEHYARSDDVQKAIHYGERAARKAARTFALEQAQRQYDRVLKLLDTLPETPERLRRQIDLSLTWAAVGVSAPTRRQVETLERFYETALALGYREGAAGCSYWIAWIEHGLGNHPAARAHAERALALSDLESQHGFVAHVYLNLGQEAYHEADYVGAVDWLARAIQTVRRVSGGDAQNIVIPTGLGYLALCAVERGRFTDAHRQVGEALAAIRSAGHRQIESSILTIVAWVHAFQGEWEPAIAAAAQMKTLGEAIAAHYVVGSSKTLMGWARVAGLGEPHSGIELLRDAAQQLERRGILLSTSLIYALLAESLARVGECAEAMRYVEKAFARCAAGDRVGEIQAHRALGRTLAREGSTSIADVRACFGRALERARVQQRPREEAVTHLAQGEVLLDARDGAGARDALGRAAALFDEMTMPWYAARARSLLS